eukprot:TRINITY_DN2135_c0_g1_i1.p1 TRINITY_DN2135_c0_g1~~TRINITY_DN2135_c0_g1_i1.p1  ORF type:complete len:351 (+),score=93.24 TRINITY_DN2135_c0_g1_i1:271-1323(+)
MKLAICLFFLFLAFVACSSKPLVSLSGLRVVNNTIVNGNSEVVQLRGVSHAGTEFACIQGWGIFDGPNDQSLLNGMLTWNINVVRVPLNEDCWLNINGVNPMYGGQNYQSAIIDFVDLINSNGMAVILDLHWNAPGSSQSTGQQPMADTDHSLDFWKGVASTFASNSMVIFDVFNEPYPDNNSWNSTEGWTCWRDGGSCNGVYYQAAGMQALIDTIRNTGATNICMLGGLQYSNSLVEWLAYKPHDPTGNLAASWHSYNFNHCNNQACWESTVAVVAQHVPVIVGESGESDCASSYVTSLYSWLESQSFTGHFLGWTWNTWDCSSGPSLISDYSGTPTPYGQGLYNILRN